MSSALWAAKPYLIQPSLAVPPTAPTLDASYAPN